MVQVLKSAGDCATPGSVAETGPSQRPAPRGLAARLTPPRPRVALAADRLRAVAAQYRCLLRALPVDDEGIDMRAASPLQVTARALAAQLHEASSEYSGVNLDGSNALAAMFAGGLADTCEAALWNVSSGAEDGPALPVDDLRTLVGQLLEYLRQAEQWCTEALERPAPALARAAAVTGGAA